MTRRYDPEEVNLLFCLFAIVAGICYYGRRREPRTEFGTARWASDKLLHSRSFLSESGLILGRTPSGRLIRLPRYCHTLPIGGTGAGKGIGVVIPNALDYHRGSLVINDTKGDLLATVGKRRRKGERVIVLAPFNGGTDRLNPLDSIPTSSPLLVDLARSTSEALVVQSGTEPDPYWNAKAVQVITAILVFVLTRFSGKERSLNSVSEIASDLEMLANTAARLRDMGGIPARLGNQLKTLFDRDGGLTKEGASVVSVVSKNLAFADSDAVARCLEDSTFDVRQLRRPGVTLFLRIPPEQLEAQKGRLRCWVATLARELSAGSEADGEVLFLLDEASALSGLPALEEILVRGRSGGCRLLLAFQSDDQVRTAFRNKPSLIYDNCDAQIYMGGANSIESADRISRGLGQWTQVVKSSGENTGWSRSSDGETGPQYSGGRSTNAAPQGRALLMPDEVLRLGEESVIALVRGFPAAILARRIKWFEDPLFNPGYKPRRRWITVRRMAFWFCVSVLGLLTVRAYTFGYGYWHVEPTRGVQWRTKSGSGMSRPWDGWGSPNYGTPSTPPRTASPTRTTGSTDRPPRQKSPPPAAKPGRNRRRRI